MGIVAELTGPPSPKSGVRLVGWWLLRLLVAALTVGLVLRGVGDLPRLTLDLTGLFFGVAGTGVLLAMFAATSRVGWVLGAAGVWAALTWYGYVALTDPFAVQVDSLGSRRGSIDSDLGAYLQGGFFLLVANVPLAAWLWWRLRRRHD
ncbi:hypothetical protein [Nocardioides plantarum]|uniref:Integral membrane protein n=1 Tax=Nocardioides plantarum TaxID=29299 RepID=A0ABV5K588_9ACTN|nr:hypothetical protein [Nocardioides plantarum]